MKTTKIKKDFLGLYVHAGGWIARPYAGTCFKEGDDVKAHHFGGSTTVGVTFPRQSLTFRKNDQFEYWMTTGSSCAEYKAKIFEPDEYKMLFGKSYTTWEEYLRLSYNWYTNNTHVPMQSAKLLNKTFKKKYFTNE